MKWLQQNSDEENHASKKAQALFMGILKPIVNEVTSKYGDVQAGTDDVIGLLAFSGYGNHRGTK